jgi:hypothetical protein
MTKNTDLLLKVSKTVCQLPPRACLRCVRALVYWTGTDMTRCARRVLNLNVRWQAAWPKRGVSGGSAGTRQMFVDPASLRTLALRSDITRRLGVLLRPL